MKDLRLLSTIHKHQAIVKVDFNFDKELIALVKTQKGARWNQTLCSWYFPRKEFRLNAFYEALKGSVFIDYSQLKKNSYTSENVTKKIIFHKPNPKVKLPLGYREQFRGQL